MNSALNRQYTKIQTLLWCGFLSRRGKTKALDDDAQIWLYAVQLCVLVKNGKLSNSKNSISVQQKGVLL